MDSRDLGWKQRAELISESLEPLNSKWHAKIIAFLLRKESASFTELRQNMDGISNKVLSDSLSKLQDQEIIQRTDEGNKEYVLTDKGKDLSPVLRELASWGESYLRDDKIKILVIEDNKEQAEMYKRWLEPKYLAEVAKSYDEALRKYREDQRIILMDRNLENSKAEDLINSLDGITDSNIVLITGMEPDLSLLDMPIKDYLIKPIGREKLIKTVNKILEVDKRTDKDKELLGLLSKKRVLDNKSSEVREKEEYHELVDRIEELKNELDNIPDSVKEDI